MEYNDLIHLYVRSIHYTTSWDDVGISIPTQGKESFSFCSSNKTKCSDPYAMSRKSVDA